jgi:hypothetical protein
MATVECNSEVNEYNTFWEKYQTVKVWKWVENVTLEICALLGNYAAYGGFFLADAPEQAIGWPLKMGSTGCTATSVMNYHYTLSNTPEERRSHLLRGGSLKPRTACFYSLWNSTHAPLLKLQIANLRNPPPQTQSNIHMHADTEYNVTQSSPPGKGICNPVAYIRHSSQLKTTSKVRQNSCCLRTDFHL